MYRVEQRKIGLGMFHHINHSSCDIFGAFSAIRPVIGSYDLYRKIRTFIFYQLNFFIRIEREMIYSHYDRQAEAVDIFNVFF
jgi:hypothetical protein